MPRPEATRLRGLREALRSFWARRGARQWVMDSCAVIVGAGRRLWSIEDVAALVDAAEAKPAKRGAYKKQATAWPISTRQRNLAEPEETQMTQQEIETELNTLRELVLRQQQQEEARRKNWRSISKSATILAVTMCVGALGLLVFGFVLDSGSPSSNTRFLGALAPLLVFVSLPLSLLRAALSDPVSPR